MEATSLRKSGAEDSRHDRAALELAPWEAA
jgi:hypothetical protein